MRRGHPGIGGWRNDNPRQFRPRGGRTPHFRPPRGYGPPDMQRYPPPMNRGLLEPPRFGHPGPLEDTSPPEHHNRNVYRGNRQNSQRGHGRQILPMIHQLRHGDVPEHNNSYMDNQNYYEGSNSGPTHMNNPMGDGDRRNMNTQQRREPYNQQISVWSVPPQGFEEQSHNKPYRRQERDGDHNKMYVADYDDHRLPPPDHYGGTSASTGNSKTFSRSVNDTVDIVRKRLLSRESHSSDNNQNDQHTPETPPIEHPSSYLRAQQDQPKKRPQRVKPNIKRNCDKIKNKIVHQLFMMDKDKIHKLMDNPSSSTKFECAISSLVTESQISFNRHLRSQAEKSLGTTEFVHNQNNTIYEDTFMKQMQGLLDPQDTLILEDLKPMVLAELSKVLQIDNLDQIQGIAGDQLGYPTTDLTFDPHPTEYYNYNEPPTFDTYDSNYYEQNPPPAVNECTENQFDQDFDNNFKSQQNMPLDSSKLFERRKSRKSCDFGRDPSVDPLQNREDRRSVDRKSTGRDGNTSVDHLQNREDRRSVDRKSTGRDRNTSVDRFQNREDRRSVDRKSTGRDRNTSVDRFQNREDRISVDRNSTDDKYRQSCTPLPLFDGVESQFSDDEDTFAELDRQYHVAVDHNFIDTDDMTPAPPAQPKQAAVSRPQTPGIKKEVQSNFCTPEKPIRVAPDVHKSNTKPLNENATKVKQEIDDQLLNIAKSPLEFTSPVRTKAKTVDEINSAFVSDTETKHDPIIKTEPTITENMSTNTTPLKQNDSSKQITDSGKIQQETHVNVTNDTTHNQAATSAKNEEHGTSIKSSTPSRKRSIDQKQSHRKEKRKKSDSCQSETNKQILNKNIIINVNDCASKSSEKCDAPKSVFNLFFSKDQSKKDVPKDNKKNELADKTYSDKYVKRKDTPKKAKDKEVEKKKHDLSTSGHSIVSSADSSNNSICVPTPSKNDANAKLKTIDIFGDLSKKPNAQPAQKNTSSAPGSNKTVLDVKTKPVIQISRKIIRKHVSTQVQRKTIARESQTERKKLFTRGMQTDPVIIKADSKSYSSDPFERMKEIDMEIQVLLQEKFKLYSSIESKDSGSSSMQSLGMAVLNVATPFEDSQQPDNDSLLEDNIVEDFVNIPVEELEQIAFESVQEERNVSTKRSQHSKVVKKSKKTKTPNISLIEQIITDDRPLEDIISLDDLEMTPAKPKKKSQTQKTKTVRNQKPLKTKKKRKTRISVEIIQDQDYDIKPCSVVLVRCDISKYLKPKLESVIEETVTNLTEAQEDSNDIVEESVVNDIQFDMLDVSEDIVIGDVCELKSEEKDSNDVSVVPICEDIILDNSQSSVEDAVGHDGGSSEGVCKTFDYLSDENLRRDTVTVTGNGDAVLALECVENDFIAACLDGNVYHFGADGTLLTTLRGSNLAVTCLTIVKEKYGTTVYTGSLDSRIRYYDLESGLEKGPECNVLSPIQSMDRAWDTIFVGTKTGFVLQFECKNNMLIPVSTVKFSEQCIMALRAMKEGPRKVLLVAARSECVTIKDAQTGLLLRTLDGPKMTVYSLLFEDGKVYCGTSSQQIYVFDYSSGSHVGSHEGGKGTVCLRATGGLLFAGCYDGCVYIYREGETKPLAQLRGPSVMLLSLAIVGTKIIAGYKDRSLYIWKIPLSIVQEMIL